MLFVTLFFILFQYVTGTEKDFSENGMKNDSSPDAFSSYSDRSFHYELATLTSNGVVTITNNVMLLSVIQLVGLENISITGHDNPTVNCDNAGGIHFDNCHNCTVIGITWEKCGTKSDSKPALRLYNSSDIIIQNCSFQHSVARAVALSEMSGKVIINSCKFLFNYFKGHGTAINYYNKHLDVQYQFTIINCNFTHNGISIVKSIVYIGSSSNSSLKQMYFMNSVFSNNKGIPLYISHQRIVASGKILFNGNVADKVGAICIFNHAKLVFHKSDTKIVNNKILYMGGVLYVGYHSSVTFEGNSTVRINNNQAKEYGGALYIQNSYVTFEGKSTLTINNNQANEYGTVFYIKKSDVTFGGNSVIKINNNHAKFGGFFYAERNSYVTFEGNSTVTIKNNTQGKLCDPDLNILENSHVKFKGNCTVIISNAVDGALHVWNNSSVTFEGKSTVTFNNNHAKKCGGILEIWTNCDITFEGNSTVTFNNNKVEHNGGTLYIKENSDVLFQGNTMVTINNNQVKDDSGTFHIRQNSSVIFEGNSVITINDNKVEGDGGAFFIRDKSDITFKGNSTVAIYNNQANGDGGALYIVVKSKFTSEGNSTVTINNNQAEDNGGALYIKDSSDVSFEGNSTVIIKNNQAKGNGGALYIEDNCDVTFKQQSTVTFNNNQAIYNGGALYSWLHSNIAFTGNSAVKFTNNTAKNSGGALHFSSNCSVLFQEYSFVEFYNNTASSHGGALSGQDNCSVKIKGSSIAIFSNNEAVDGGGALYSNNNCHIKFQENSSIKFSNNKATNSGGAILSKYSSKIIFENNCTTTFNHNEASSKGGAIFIQSNILFKENSTVKFNNNKATFGGALHISNVTFEENAVVTFDNNEALLNGGALYSHFLITLKQKCTIIFTNNRAENGGAAFTSTSTILVSEYSNVTIKNNVAKQNGGAICFDELISAMFKDLSTITVAFNTANYGGGIYIKITQSTKYFNLSELYFSNNTARVSGDILYIDVVKSCNVSCLTDRIVGISNETLQRGSVGNKVATSPSTLKIHYPAKCIKNNTAECELYYIESIMLGQEIIIYACLLDYYNQPAEATQFKVISEIYKLFFVHGSEFTSISCNHTIEGISIIGNKPISGLPLNFSVILSLYTRKSERKTISVKLTVGLSPCHPGFYYQGKSQICECYNNSGIVHCSGSSSTIKRGYWFGHVTGIPTVTFCPINYCNFTCCKTTNGYYDLSPERANQCRSQRSGTACGSCEKGYTLSFDSAECIDINKCSIGLTILVVMLTVLYWFAVVVTVFITRYYRVNIGYLYAFTYYYTLVDILLKQHTNELHIMVIIMSSIAKMTPQFLEQFCLFENMSGIDQQFLHYTHPIAISVILIIINWLARYYKRFSAFISRGIIHAICLLMLLSYTSVATTSLLLMRSLSFVDVDKVYTYVSPDIQYFHGRHLAYGIIAIMFTLLVVIGLPLLLLLEPFLNRKVNFYRIKPLLDQFQGCYKKRYRYFAAYYMICRLIILTIIIVNTSEVFISQCLLIIASIIIALIHLMVRPYSDNILNMSDGVILHLMTLVTVLPLFEYYDTFNSSVLIGIAFVLVILPLVYFVVIKTFTSKQTLKEIIKNIITYCYKTQESEPNNVIANNTAASYNFDLIIDDNMRRNTTVCEMYVSI